MGLFSWLLGNKKQSKQIVHLEGDGSFELEIVGESFYQDALDNITGGKTEDGYEMEVEAMLNYDDDNPYDNKAIAVSIEGEKVGHLSRKLARQFRERMEETGCPGASAVCKALIVGGWDRGNGDRGDFGVKLDLPTSIQKYEEIKEEPKVSELSFTITQIDDYEISQIKVGDDVKFWSPNNSPSKIIIYRSGSVGGQGRLGEVPKKHARLVADHMSSSLPINTEIIEITPSTCTIRCRLVSAEELKQEKENEQQKLQHELNKPYRPRKPLKFSIDAKSISLSVGDKLLLAKIPTIDNYCANPYKAVLVITSLDGSKIIEKSDEPTIIKKIVRLNNTFDKLNISVISKENDKHWYKSEYKIQVTPDNT